MFVTPAVQDVTPLIPLLHTDASHRSTKPMTLPRPPSRLGPRRHCPRIAAAAPPFLLPSAMRFLQSVCLHFSQYPQCTPGTGHSCLAVYDPCLSRPSCLYLCPCHPCSCLSLSSCPCRRSLCQKEMPTLHGSGPPPSAQGPEIEAKRIQRSRCIPATSLRTHATSHAEHCKMRAHWKGLVSGILIIFRRVFQHRSRQDARDVLSARCPIEADGLLPPVQRLHHPASLSCVSLPISSRVESFPQQRCLSVPRLALVFQFQLTPFPCQPAGQCQEPFRQVSLRRLRTVVLRSFELPTPKSYSRLGEQTVTQHPTDVPNRPTRSKPQT